MVRVVLVLALMFLSIAGAISYFVFVPPPQWQVTTKLERHP